MGQLVTATRAGLGSGLPALRRCRSAGKPIFSGELKAVGARRKCMEGKRMVRAAFLHPTHGGEGSGWWIGIFRPYPGTASRAEPRRRDPRGGITSLPTEGWTGLGPHPALGGSFSRGSG